MSSTYTWAFDLQDATRIVLAHGLAGEATAPLLTIDNWSALRSEVSRHRLDGLLVAAVASGELPTTIEQRAEVAQIEVGLTLARMWQERRFVQVLEDLAAGGVEARVLKGRGLAVLDYPDPQWRPTSDLDVLVRGAQLDRAREIVGKDGGEQRDLDPTPGYGATIGKGGGVTQADGLEVDLHRVLVAGAFGVRIRVDDLWADPRTFELGGLECTTLSLEASLLHACYHLLIFGFPRALTVRDVGQLLLAPDLDADRVLWLARRWDALVILSAALRMAHAELGLRAESMLLDWANGYEPRVRDRMWLRIERSGDHISPLMAIGEYLALRTPAERALFRRATFNPAPDTWPPAHARALRLARRLAAGAFPRHVLPAPDPRLRSI